MQQVTPPTPASRMRAALYRLAHAADAVQTPPEPANTGRSNGKRSPLLHGPLQPGPGNASAGATALHRH